MNGRGRGIALGLASAAEKIAGAYTKKKQTQALLSALTGEGDIDVERLAGIGLEPDEIIKIVESARTQRQARELIEQAKRGELGSLEISSWQPGEMPTFKPRARMTPYQEATESRALYNLQKQEQAGREKRRLADILIKQGELVARRKRLAERGITPTGYETYRERVAIPTGEEVLTRAETIPGIDMPTPSWMKTEKTVSRTTEFNTDLQSGIDAIGKGADPDKVFDRILEAYPDKVNTIESLRFKYGGKI